MDFLEPFACMNNDKRNEVTMKSLVSINEGGRLIGSRGDAIRGSFVPAREVARRRIDPKRGSYVNENQRFEDLDPDLIDIPFSK